MGNLVIALPLGLLIAQDNLTALLMQTVGPVNRVLMQLLGSLFSAQDMFHQHLRASTQQ